MTRTLVYSQDSGGAAVVARVASRLEAVPSLPPRVTAVHPLSEALFRRLGVTATPVSKWLDTLPASDRAIDRWLDDIQVSHLICSLSSTRLDLTNARLIARARARGVRTLGYLDHWVGFERLTTLNGEQDYLPDLIGCIDSYCRQALIHLGVSADAVREVGQPQLEAVAREVGPASVLPGQPAHILLVSQPVAADGSFLGVFHLETAGRSVLEHIMDAVEPFVRAGTVVVKYRAHPKERSGPPVPSQIPVDLHPSGLASLSKHHIFVGVTSMLLFEAAVARRTVIQLDIPVLRRTLDGAWPPYRVGIQVTEPADLRVAVAHAVSQLRLGVRPVAPEGLALEGSLDRATELAVAFLRGKVLSGSLGTR